MTEGPRPPQSQLAPFASSWRDGDPTFAWQRCEDAWHEHGTLGGLPLKEIEARKGFAAARKSRLLAEELFGRRRGDCR